jgi:hypothetical protein
MTLTFTNPFPNLKKHLSSLTKSNNMDDWLLFLFPCFV